MRLSIILLLSLGCLAASASARSIRSETNDIELRSFDLEVIIAKCYTNKSSHALL